MVKQEMAPIELCGIEAKQRYRISVPNSDNSEGGVFLYIHEEGECAERICCGPNRSLTLMVHQGNSKEGPVVQSMYKPFSLQGCCCMRPSFMVWGPGGKMANDVLGNIEDPWRCCLMDQQVYNNKRELVFTTEGSICQPGVCCPLCCDVEFKVKKNGNKVANINKMALSCAEMCLHTNRFMIDFGGITDPAERKLLLSSAMLLDLEYF